MLRISRFTCEGLENNVVTDEKNPAFSYTVESDLAETVIQSAVLTVNGWKLETTEQIALVYKGAALAPFTTYVAQLTVRDNHGEEASANLTFATGRLDTPWQGKWITDGDYGFTEKHVSPRPMTFKKAFQFEKEVASVCIYATAIGIYELKLNGEKVGQDFFAPGFTSYKTNLQYQVYDVTEQIQKENVLYATIAGGWAVGSFVMNRKNRITADRQALLMEVRVTYTDGTVEVIATDENWQVAMNGAFEEADFYDGERFDARVDWAELSYHPASLETVRIKPQITATYGSLVRAQEIMKPVSVTQHGEEIIVDFGQNFAGVVELTIQGRAGQTITVRHAELLEEAGSLNTTFLRTAKATATYICRDGEQTYHPRFTYMGFRYISIKGASLDELLSISALALYSQVDKIGEFISSNEALNQLQSNITWSAKSNFVDIPTDCPQRDERMGWTGDIAVFAPTANYLFDTTRFLDKWMLDVKAEQLPTGGIPNTVPAQGFGFPETMPTLAVAFWGDACVLVPWSLYQSTGDQRILEKYYDTMKRYVDACKKWAGYLSFGLNRYVWHTHHMLQFGDWVAPDVPQMSQWQKRSKWTATASLKNTSHLLSQIANLLGKSADATRYQTISEKTSQAYEELLTENGKLAEEFQTGYVLPLYYNMLSESAKKVALTRLVKLVEENDYKIGTGFPGTPYILFALADNGYADVAYKMLLNDACPSWLHEVKMGATTIWERWDGLDESGKCPIGDDGTDQMISYNHYASGAVGDFLYRRIAGIEALTPGYRTFQIKPIIGGGLTEVTARHESPYGTIAVFWKVTAEGLAVDIEVPVGTTCSLTVPGLETKEYQSGNYHLFVEKEHGKD